jgi:hypothetical protein
VPLFRSRQIGSDGPKVRTYPDFGPSLSLQRPHLPAYRSSKPIRSAAFINNTTAYLAVQYIPPTLCSANLTHSVKSFRLRVPIPHTLPKRSAASHHIMAIHAAHTFKSLASRLVVIGLLLSGCTWLAVKSITWTIKCTYACRWRWSAYHRPQLLTTVSKPRKRAVQHGRG